MRFAVAALIAGLLLLPTAYARENAVRTMSASVLKVLASAPSGGQAFGSAVVIAPGRLVTSCHVLRGAQRIEVVRGSQRWAAERSAGDSEKDVCLLAAPGLDAPPARIGSAARLSVGETVYASGYPGGGELVTQRGRVESLYRFRGGKVIQTSAAFDPGASGGALFTASGQLVGIPTFKAPSGGAFHFAVPADWIATVEAAGQRPGGEQAFWERAPQQRAYFLRAVWHEAERNWPAMFRVCEHWNANEPESDEPRQAMVRAAAHMLEVPRSEPVPDPLAAAPAVVDAQRPSTVEAQQPSAVESQRLSAVESQRPSAVESQRPSAGDTQQLSAVDPQQPRTVDPQQSRTVDPLPPPPQLSAAR